MKVRTTRACLRQIDAAVAYLTTQNPQATRGLQARLFAVVALLEAYLFSGCETGRRGIRGFQPGTYPYWLEYSGDADEIVLRRFRHTSRRPLA